MLKIILVDEQIKRAASVQEALVSCGCEVISLLSSPFELYERISQSAPDAIVIDIEMPSPEVFAHISLVSRDLPLPIVMFAADREEETIRCAIRAGVTTYVVDGLAAERIQPILNVAIERFAAEQALKNELADAKDALSERKVIERAKGIVMSQAEVAEGEAFRRLRKYAMDRGIKIAEAAQQIIRSSKLLGYSEK